MPASLGTATTPASSGLSYFLHALLSEPSPTQSRFSVLTPPGQTAGDTWPPHQEDRAGVRSFARHWFPNISTAAVHVERKRADDCFTRHHRRPTGRRLPAGARASREDAEGVPNGFTCTARTPVEAVRLLPSLLLRAAVCVVQCGGGVSLLHPPLFPQAVSSNPMALANQATFCRGVLEQAMLQLYLYPKGPLPEEDPSTSRPPPFYAAAYAVPYAKLPWSLRDRIEATLSVILASTVFSFHISFEQLVRRHQRAALALELFQLWWMVNPDQMPIELPERLLPTTSASPMLFLTGGSPGLSVIERNLRSFVEGLNDDDLERLHRQGGFLTPELLLPISYREELRAQLNRLPFKKFYVTSALLPRVLQIGATVVRDDLDSSHKGAEHRRVQDITTAAQRWVLSVVCATHVERQTGQDILRIAETEKWEDWLLLMAVPMAVGSIESHLKVLRQLPRRGGNRHPQEAAEPCGPPATALSARCYEDLLDVLRQEWIDKVTHLSLTVEAASDPSRRGAALRVVEGWSRLTFAAVRNCFESSGVLNRVSAHRPPTAGRFWQMLHHVLVDTFPQALHARSTVATLWTLTALEGMTCRIPCGPLPTASVAVELGTAAWRTITLPPGPHRPDGSSALSMTPAFSEDLVILREGHGYMPQAERQKRTQFVIAHIGGGASDNSTRGSRNRSQLQYPAPSFASQLTSPPTLTADEAQHIAALHSALGALCEVRSAALDVVRRHATLGTLNSRDAVLTAEEMLEREALSTSAGFPSFYIMVKLLQLLAQWGELLPAAHITPGSIKGCHGDLAQSLVACIDADLAPECGPLMRNYLESLAIQHLANSGAAGAVPLVTSHRLEELPPNIAWSRLLEGLLWSTLPASALPSLYGQSGSATQLSLSSFGAGSLAWKVLRAHCEDMHTRLERPPDLDPGEAAESVLSWRAMRHGEETFTRDACTTLGIVLHHLAVLSFQTSEDARCLTCCAPLLRDGLSFQEAPHPLEDSAKAADGLGANDSDYAVEYVGMGEASTDPEDSGEEMWLRAMDDVSEPPATTADIEVGRHAGPVVASLLAADLHEEDPKGCDDASLSAKTVESSETPPEPRELYGLRWAAPGQLHLFYSVLQAVAWVLYPPTAGDGSDKAAPLPPLGGRRDGERAEWTKALTANYRRVLSPYLSVPCEDTRHRQLLHHPPLMEKLLLVVLNTCPDVLLLTAMLTQWCGSVVKERAKHRTRGASEEAVRASNCVLTAPLECSLCQVLHHAGISAATVRHWRQRLLLERGDGVQVGGQTFETLHQLHWDALRTFHNTLANHESTIPTTPDELAYVLGSITLLALDERCARSSGRKRVTLSPHPHNFYVYAFLYQGEQVIGGSSTATPLEGPGRDAARQVVLPSQQLMSFAPARAPPQQAHHWSETWQRRLSTAQRRALSRRLSGRRVETGLPQPAWALRGNASKDVMADDGTFEDAFVKVFVDESLLEGF